MSFKILYNFWNMINLSCYNAEPKVLVLCRITMSQSEHSQKVHWPPKNKGTRIYLKQNVKLHYPQTIKDQSKLKYNWNINKLKLN